MEKLHTQEFFPDSEWPNHYNLECSDKRHYKEGTLWKLQCNEEDFYWSLKEVGDVLKPQERIYLQRKFIALFKKSPNSLLLKDIASKAGASYEL